MTDELKPCPFCGGEAEYVQVMNHAGKIRCTKCCGQSGIFQDCHDVWNHRPIEDALREKVKRLEDEFDYMENRWPEIYDSVKKWSDKKALEEKHG